jgi:chaperonin cofactor prefoldin
MTTFHQLRIQRRELLDDLDELEASVAELTAVLSESIAIDADELTDHHERLAWLRRQHAGVLVILSETERALLEFDADDWDAV